MATTPLEDGVTHINIYSKGETLLGQMLSNFYYSPFLHPVYGAFASVEGFWYWLKTGKLHDDLRQLYGHQAKKVGKTYDVVGVVGFDNHIRMAIACKLLHNRDILEELIESDLPFKHYYYYGEKDNAKVIELPEYEWMCEFYEEQRAYVKGA